jgi:hypothetical protein
MPHDTNTIVAWRREQLSRVGYSDFDAEMLALRKDVDLHVAVDLVARGCPPPLAVEILL